MMVFRTTTVLSLCLLVLGCASAKISRSSKEVMPVSYELLESARIVRSVGKLRRLAALPVQLGVSPENPKGCLGACGWVGLDRLIEEEAILFLRDKRGYEVVALQDAAAGGNAGFSPEELSQYARMLATNAREGTPDQPPDEVVTLVRRVGERTGVDGLLVIQGKATDMGLAEWGLAYASFSLTLPLSLMRMGVSLRADVFEAKTGRNVWTSTLSSGGVPNASEHYAMLLLGPIEPAVPRVLTK